MVTEEWLSIYDRYRKKCIINIINIMNENQNEELTYDIVLYSIGGSGTRCVVNGIVSSSNKAQAKVKVIHRHDPQNFLCNFNEKTTNPNLRLIYIHNDPLLALLSRYRRHIAIHGFYEANSNISLELKDKLKIKGYSKSQFIGLSHNDQREQHETFFKNLLLQTLSNEDCYGFENHFNNMLALANHIGREKCLFLDFRDLNASQKIKNFLKLIKPVTLKYVPSCRISNIEQLKTLTPDYEHTINFYKEIDQTIINNINNL